MPTPVDFLCASPGHHVAKYIAALRSIFEVRVKIMGPREAQQKEGHVEQKDQAEVKGPWEADPRLVVKITSELRLEEARGCATPPDDKKWTE